MSPSLLASVHNHKSNDNVTESIKYGVFLVLILVFYSERNTKCDESGQELIRQENSTASEYAMSLDLGTFGYISRGNMEMFLTTVLPVYVPSPPPQTIVRGEGGSASIFLHDAKGG